MTDNKFQFTNMIRAFTLSSQVSATLITCTLVGLYLGKVLDDVLKTSPWLLFVCCLLGLAAAFKGILDLAKRQIVR